MKKISIFVILFVLATTTIIHVKAQTNEIQRVVYDFSFQRNPDDVNSKIKEQFVLDIFPDYSRFVSLDKIKRDRQMDSIRKAAEAQVAAGTKMVNVVGSRIGAANYEIFKYNTGKVIFQQNIARDKYGYEEDMSTLQWNVTDSTLQYGKYNCQLAKLSYGGRNWSALFTTDVPINNGPYKFLGLPGLIVKMWDDKDHCLFELAEIKKIAEENTEIPKVEMVKKKDFLAMQENASSQPLSGLLGGSTSGAGTISKITMRDQNGNEISQEEMQRKIAEIRKKNSNKIELQ